MALDQLKSVLTYRFSHDNVREQPANAGPWATALAAQAGAHLSVVIATQLHSVSNVMGASLVSGVVSGENRKLAEAAEARVAAACAAATAAGVECNARVLHKSYPEVRANLTSCSRLFDVVVADAAPEASSMQRELLVDILFQAARPLVIVPAVTTPQLDHVVVAWDGTAPATRALNDAMPLLRGAKSVDVVTIAGDKELPDGGHAADIVPHLVRHGIPATAREIALNRGDAAQTLIHHAVSTNAGLLVMGAYAHSRFRQMVFGGVTSALLKDCPVPLLMSH